jgi:hypothetical protein
MKYYSKIIDIAEAEADWPHLSMITGFAENDTTGLTPGPYNSVYKYMRQRNRCVHRGMLPFIIH